jgi:hypothetical protein
MKKLLVILSVLIVLGCATAQTKPVDPETAKQEEMQKQTAWGIFSDVIGIIGFIALH